MQLFDAGGDGWHGGYLEILDKFGDVLVGPISPDAADYAETFDYFCHCGIDEYACHCLAGYANGVCEYDYISQYDTECTIMSGGSCDIDVDECASNPCVNGAACVDSTVDATITVHAYRCMCAAGYAGGLCDYDFIDEVTANPDHEFRRNLDERIAGMADRLRDSPELHDRAHELKHELLAHPAVREWTSGLWANMKQATLLAADDPTSELRLRIHATALSAGEALRNFRTRSTTGLWAPWRTWPARAVTRSPT